MDRLPPELIDLIHKHLDPLSILHLALANRQLAAHSSDALKLISERHETYLTLCDTDVAAASTVLHDSAVAWHVRNLELSRQEHTRLLNDTGQTQIPSGADDSEDVYRLWPRLQEDGRWGSDFEDRINSITGLDLSMDHHDDSQRRDIYQTLLILCCTRMRMLKTFLRGPTDADGPGKGFLRAIAQEVSKMPEPLWPDSLTSLRQVALNLPSPGEDDWAVLPSKKALPIFQLPNLETVYLRGLDRSDFAYEELSSPGMLHMDIIPPRSSSVRHLCLENCTSEGPYDVNNIVMACRKLETLVLSSCGIRYVDWVVQYLEEWQQANIKTFFACGDVFHIWGYRGLCYMDCYKELSQLEVAPMELDELVNAVNNFQRWRRTGYRDCCEHWFDEIGSKLQGPTSIITSGPYFDSEGRESLYDMGIGARSPHTLVLYAKCVLLPLHEGAEATQELLDAVDEGLAGFMSPDGEFPVNLRTMYLDKAVDRLVLKGMIESREMAFSKTREAAKRCGHTVHCEEGALDRFAQEMCRPMFGVGLEMETTLVH